jgi:hypothetical protein
MPIYKATLALLSGPGIHPYESTNIVAASESRGIRCHCVGDRATAAGGMMRGHQAPYDFTLPDSIKCAGNG